MGGTPLAALTIVVLFEAMALVTIVGSSGRAGLAVGLSGWQVAGLGVVCLTGGWITAFIAGRRQRS